MNKYAVILVLVLAIMLGALYWSKRDDSPVMKPGKSPYRFADGNVVKDGNDFFGYPAEAVDANKIKTLLAGKKWEELNLLLDKYEKEAQEDIHKEFVPIKAYEIIAWNAATFNVLNEWAREYPDSYQPFLARAQYYHLMGWEADAVSTTGNVDEERLSYMKYCFSRSLQDVITVLELKPKLILPYVMLIRINMALSRQKSNEHIIKKTLKIFPDSYAIASAYMYSLNPRWGGDKKKMKRFANKMARTKNPRMIMLQGYIDTAAADVKICEKKYEQSAELYSRAAYWGDNAIIQRNIAFCFFNLKRYDQASVAVNRALSLSPLDTDSHLLRAKILFMSGNTLASMTDIRMTEKISSNYPGLARTKNWMSDQLLRDGYLLYKDQRYSDALEKINLAQSLSPQYSEPYFYRGVMYAELKDYKRALSDLRRATSMNAEHFASYIWLDFVLTKQQKWKEAISCWNKYIDQEPENPKAYLQRSAAYYRAGNLSAAISDARRSAQLGDVEGQKRYEMLRTMKR